MQKTKDQYVEEQRALLEDPIAFVHKAWDALIGSGPLDSLLSCDLPKVAWDNVDEALNLVRVVARTPCPDLYRCLDLTTDAATSLATEQHTKGMELGAVLEQLRQGLLRAHASAQEPHANDVERAQAIAELRAKLTECDHA